MILEDSQLAGDVDCTQVAPGTACIKFGADHITLRLNGFTITGNADPALGYVPTQRSPAEVEKTALTLLAAVAIYRSWDPGCA